MEQPPVAHNNQRTTGWWEYPVIVLIALSAVPAYAALCMTIVAWAVLKYHPAMLGDLGGELQPWADVARFFAMATAPFGLVTCITVSLVSFRSRATKLGWLIMVGGFLAWSVAIWAGFAFLKIQIHRRREHAQGDLPHPRHH